MICDLSKANDLFHMSCEIVAGMHRKFRMKEKLEDKLLIKMIII